MLAEDCAPLVALADGLADAGFAVETLAVTSLKDPQVVADLAARLAALSPAIIVNTTAFSARLAEGGTVLDRAGVPVLQAPLALADRAAWAASPRVPRRHRPRHERRVARGRRPYRCCR